MVAQASERKQRRSKAYKTKQEISGPNFRSKRANKDESLAEELWKKARILE
jgi:hypothetical protein